MTTPDLTPARYIDRAKAKATLRFWLMPLALCLVFAVGAVSFQQAMPQDNASQSAQQRIAQATSQLETSQAQLARQSPLLTQHQREVQAQQHLTQRPDWSGVLELIAAQFDDRLMMTDCRLGQASDTAVRSGLGAIHADVPVDSVWMIVRGVAEANRDVPGLILRLESLGLFERVVMTNSEGASFSGRSRTTFTLACRVPSGAER